MHEFVADAKPPLQHIGFIVDGNRRWARERDKGAQYGHKHGFERLKSLLKHANKKAIPFVSAYVFSTENWKRAKDEVGYLMDLVIKVVSKDLEELKKENVKLVHIGSREGVPERVLEAVDKAVEDTKNNSGIVFGLCFNYGGHREIVNATKAIVDSGVDASEIDEKLIESHLYAPDVPPLDLVVRTSGEQRLSNFMLWRASYAELYFTDTYWPDFDEAELDEALAWYAQRQRRFGGN